ncbi:MAG: O-antigen ligase family protein [Muribaculum sp.]|nr:O-antigen ligase family protein [Muribaculum sp.]
MPHISKYIIPSCLILPMILHWILPWGIESRLYVKIANISLFVPDFLYVYYLYGQYLRDDFPVLPSARKNCILTIIFFILIYVLVCGVLKNIGYIDALMVNNLSFFWLVIVFIFNPLDKEQIQLTKPLMLFALVFLVLEVLLYSLGILHYTTAAHTALQGQDYGGVMRISTTVGAATGTAVIIGLLGAICLTAYRWATMRQQIIIIILTSFGVFFTMSRGTSLCWASFVLYFFYTNYFRNYTFSKRVKSILILAAGLAAFYYVGGFNPILNRYEHMKASEDATAGRGSKFEKSMRMIDESAPWGYGIGQVMPEKSIEKDFRTPHHFAPHNAYTLVWIELGWPGLVMFLLLIIALFSASDYRKPLFVYLILYFAINANTESVILDSEFAALSMFAFMTIIKYSTFAR